MSNLTGGAAAPAQHATAERVAGVSRMTRLMERATGLLEPPHALFILEQRSVPPKSNHVPARGPGYVTVRSMLDPGSAALPPAMLHPSSPAAPSTMLMPDQPRTAIIMVCQAGVDDGRGLSAAYTARELNVLSGASSLQLESVRSIS